MREQENKLLTKEALDTIEEYAVKLAEYELLDLSNIRQGTNNGHPCPGIILGHKIIDTGVPQVMEVSVLKGKAITALHLLLDVSFENKEEKLRLAFIFDESLLVFLSAAINAGVFALLDQNPDDMAPKDKVHVGFVRVNGALIEYTTFVANTLEMMATAGLLEPKDCKCKTCKTKKDDPLHEMTEEERLAKLLDVGEKG